MNLKKFTAMILVLCIMFSLISCSDSSGTSSDNQETNKVNQPEETTVDENALLYSDVPTGDFEQYEFRMLNNISNFAYTEMTAE